MWTADDMVDSVFLIYLKNIDNRGFCIRFRSLSTLFIQWGMILLKNGKGEIILPISANNIACILQHCGVSPQYNAIDNSMKIYSSMSNPETISFIAITK